MDVRQPNRPVTWLPMSGKLRGLVAGALLASGMTALAAPPQKRAAILLPPVKVEPGELPAVARGAMDDSPIGSTPVVRKKSSANDGPAWLTGADPSVLPASGSIPSRSTNEVRSAVGSTTKDIPPLTPNKLMGPQGGMPTSKALEKMKLPAMGERSMPSAEMQPDPNTPLRGMAANGAPLMAGPPAYRWYGYGSPTPGANAYAPTGQYPKASANWYGVTGATPGAFPVPVVNPYRAAAGSEPPDYTMMPPSRTTIAAPGMAMGGGTIEMPNGSNVVAVPPPAGVRPAPSNVKPSIAQPGVPAMPPIGSIGTGAMAPGGPLPPLPHPVGVPVMPAPPRPEPVKVQPAAVVPPALPVSPAVKPAVEETKKPVVGSPVVVSKPAEPLAPLPAAAPEPLPPALTEDNTWKPVAAPSGAAPVLPPPGLFVEPGAKVVKHEIVRGQMPDSSRSDPAIALVQAVCKDRAAAIDVRWTSSKKLTVCFEVRSQSDANQLVKDVCARPELAPLAIDFCVVVK